jgi:hypothetical protein
LNTFLRADTMRELSGRVDDPNFRIDFLGIGVAKSGSTWLAETLRLHPRIFIPTEKSIYYFNQFREKSSKPNLKYKKPLKWYHSFFEQAIADQITGEICPEYLIQGNCAEDIFRYNPNIKLLATLRDPVQRAFSQYLFRQQIGRSDYGSFDEAIRDFPALLESSLYYKHLRSYFDRFPRDNICVIFYEDLLKDARAYFKRILSFLGVEEFYPGDLAKKINVTMEVRSRVLGGLITSVDLFFKHRPGLQWIRNAAGSLGLERLAHAMSRANKRSVLEKPRMDADLSRRLKAVFADDIEKLESLLGKDLSHWK